MPGGMFKLRFDRYITPRTYLTTVSLVLALFLPIITVQQLSLTSFPPTRISKYDLINPVINPGHHYMDSSWTSDRQVSFRAVHFTQRPAGRAGFQTLRHTQFFSCQQYANYVQYSAGGTSRLASSTFAFVVLRIARFRIFAVDLWQV